MTLGWVKIFVRATVFLHVRPDFIAWCQLSRSIEQLVQNHWVISFYSVKYVYHSNLHLFPLSTRSSDWSWSVFNKARGHTLSDKVKLALEPPSTASYCIKRLNSQHRKRCPERMQGARLDEVSHRVRNLTRLCISFLTVTSWDKQSWTVRAALSGITGVWWTLIGSQPRHNLVRACCLHFC